MTRNPIHTVQITEPHLHVSQYYQFMHKSKCLFIQLQTKLEIKSNLININKIDIELELFYVYSNLKNFKGKHFFLNQP